MMHLLCEDGGMGLQLLVVGNESGNHHELSSRLKCQHPSFQFKLYMNRRGASVKEESGRSLVEVG